jgi:hypothetical protein
MAPGGECVFYPVDHVMTIIYAQRHRVCAQRRRDAREQQPDAKDALLRLRRWIRQSREAGSEPSGGDRQLRLADAEKRKEIYRIVPSVMTTRPPNIL